MTPKLLRTAHAEYIPAPYTGKNSSGWEPALDRVLVRPDIASVRSSGGVELPEDLTDRMQMAAITGVVIAVGDDAFKWNADGTRLFEGYKPVPGDRVIFEKYAGKPILGEDGQDYRLLDYKSIGGVKKRNET